MFLQILPSQQEAGEGLSYPHLARVDTSTQHTTFLTSGPMVVRDILAWDQVTSGWGRAGHVTLIGQEIDTVYFMATGAGQPGSLHLYTVAAQGEQMTRAT